MDDSRQFDVVVIGVGTAGGSVIWPLHDAGLKVAAVEKELVGGLCAYWGCIPSKTLLRPGTIGWEARHGFGVTEPSVAWKEIATYRDWMVRGWSDEKDVEKLSQAGVSFYRGEATITQPGEVCVDGQALRTRDIVVATGSVPTIPPIDGLKETGYWTNREATSFHEVPKSIIVVGGGAEGSELAQVFHGYGAKVTIVEEADQLLGHESPDAAMHLQQRFTSIGITLYLGRKAVRFERKNGRKLATLDNGEIVSAHEVLVCVGRHPETANLGLARVGVKTSERGIEIDEHCRAAENIWAVGDVTGVAGFTHVADYQGHIVSLALLGTPRSADYSAIPSVTYTDPEVASVGITSTEKAPRDMDMVQVHVPLSASSRVDTYGQGYQGGLCLFADRREKVLVGAWAVGPLASEWVQFATLAIRGKVPIQVLDDTMLAFPTFTRLYLDPIQKLQQQLAGS